MNTKLHILTRLVLFLAAAALIMMLFIPLWRIELNAPQYPEGLRLLINTDGLSGDVDIVNGLNHYIGMKTLHNKDFIEFAILPYIIVFFAIASILVSIVNRRKWLNILFFSFVTFGIIAFADFWRWEYDYGHDLDPNAAIVVPGMAYQPPLIGFKQLLNFGAYSIPDKGGWIFISVGLLLLAMFVFEWKRIRKLKFDRRKPAALAIIMIMMLSGCNNAPEPLKTGYDQCYSCKMTISDHRFGAVLVTKKGKQFNFDDIQCLLGTVRSGYLDTKSSDIYFVDFSNNHLLHHSKNSFLLHSQTIKGPMNGDVISFSNKESFDSAMISMNGKPASWEELIK